MLHVIADAQGEETDPVSYSNFTWALRHPYRINYLFQIHEGKTVSDQLEMYLPNIFFLKSDNLCYCKIVSYHLYGFQWFIKI